MQFFFFIIIVSYDHALYAICWSTPRSLLFLYISNRFCNIYLRKLFQNCIHFVWQMCEERTSVRFFV